MKEEELTGADSALRLFVSVAGDTSWSICARSAMLFKTQERRKYEVVRRLTRFMHTFIRAVTQY